MENIKLYGLIYELKGLIESMSEMAAHDDEYNNPLIDKVETKMNMIVIEIENSGA